MKSINAIEKIENPTEPEDNSNNNNDNQDDNEEQNELLLENQENDDDDVDIIVAHNKSNTYSETTFANFTPEIQLESAYNRFTAGYNEVVSSINEYNSNWYEGKEEKQDFFDELKEQAEKARERVENMYWDGSVDEQEDYQENQGTNSKSGGNSFEDEYQSQIEIPPKK